MRPLLLLRAFQIYATLMRYGLTPEVVGDQSQTLLLLSRMNVFAWGKKSYPRGEAIRLAFERLGPIFVKFGQLLSTRPDLFPKDIVAELSRLQDQVPPFPGKEAKHIIEKSFEQPITSIFKTFDETPLASASIAQVHAATLFDGKEVVVKVTRPNIDKIIRQDLALMKRAAKLIDRLWRGGRRLRLPEMVAEFETTIYDELDLQREAANASQLRRNFRHSAMLYVPEVYWAYTKSNIMVMERIYGVPISDVATLKNKHTNLKKLAEHGVEIFFTQVFRDSFFHADMHPGNLFVNVNDPDNPIYNGVDFGIMGTLGPEDQKYIAENLLAFFNRDYRRVALLHIESGWVPEDTRVDQFESAIRTVCEPIFERPLKDISFAKLLLRLFQTAERFNMQMQPQLMLLQKTLFNIEGLGRELYPDLNLWETAKPYLEKWIRKQYSVTQNAKRLIEEFPEVSEKIIKTPELFFQVLSNIEKEQRRRQLQMTQIQKTKTGLPRVGLAVGAGLALLAAGIVSFFIPDMRAEQMMMLEVVLGGVLLIVGLIVK